MCYREDVEVKFILKIKQNFKDNPILSLSANDIKSIEGPVAVSGEEEEENEGNEDENFEKLMNNKENIDEIFEKQTKFKKLYIDELVIYKIDD